MSIGGAVTVAARRVEGGHRRARDGGDEAMRQAAARVRVVVRVAERRQVQALVRSCMGCV